jgi:hypothetical protein
MFWTKKTSMGPSVGPLSQRWFFGLFFDRGELLKRYVVHYKPCPMTSLSSRKSWEIFALPIEKIDF